MRKATAEHGGLFGLFEADVTFYRDEPFRDYRPRFGIEPEDAKTIWITDHGRRVALLDKNDYLIDLFEFQPGHPRLQNPQKPPVYHAPTLLGARLTLAQWIGKQGRTSDTWELAIEESVDQVAFTITERWNKPQRRSTKRIDVRVHPQFGYVVFTSDAMRSAEPVDLEVYNFLVKGLTHHHPAKRRFPLVAWRSASRGLLKWTSNMVSLRCAGHQDKEFARNLGTNGWLGFFGEPDWNPIYALNEASRPCTVATCDNLLDEHFCFAPPPAMNGEYVFSCQGALLALPGQVADQLLEHAAFNELLADQPNPAWPYSVSPRLRPFNLNQLCDFENSIPLDGYYRGQYWFAAENGGEWAAISGEKAHSGRWSLRLRVRPEDGEKSISPMGSTMWLETGRSYRVSAYVCHDGKGTGQFRLCVSQAYFTYAENRDPKEARCDATSSTAWQRLELTFTALPNDPCAVVQLVAGGDGRWFIDDVLLEEITVGRTGH
ncbi:MAG: hypothetical protein HY360_10700 [Verrucomicrobia bacterium]|nr:hypothetical protein [Verrucomicrobiota bacterium]